MDVQIAVEGSVLQAVPDAQQIQVWANAAVQHAAPDQRANQMTVRIVELEEITQLNQQYRKKSGPTNVLSFPFDALPGMPSEIAESELGDVVVSAVVVENEAAAQGKTSAAHWAHMVVHGTLHLLGYDHVQDDEAQKMESLEVAVLAELGYANPYS